MKKEIEEFLVDLGLKKRTSRTIANYKRYLERFVDLVGISRIEDISEKSVQSFVKKLHDFTDRLGEPLTDKTINYHLTALRSFLKFLDKHGSKSLHYSAIKLIDIGVSKKREAKSHQIKALGQAVKKDGSIVEKRDAAIVDMLTDTGMRVSELSNLKRDGFDLEKKTVLIDRWGEGVHLELGNKAVSSLAAYIKARSDNNPHLFVSYDKAASAKKRAAASNKPLTSRSIQRILKRYSDKIAVGYDITPASLRNAAIAKMVASGADVETVTKKMGFKNKRSAQATIKNLPR